MSIPPLVCSSPPPPDQCEDEKDPEDFDLPYSLSQEDDDDENIEYNYSNFSSYNHFQSASDNKPLEIKNQDITKSTDNEVHKEMFIQYENCKVSEQSNGSSDRFRINDINENKLKCEEDMNIEDLNLKVDEEIVTSIVDNSDENQIRNQNADKLKDLNIPCNSNNSSQNEDNSNVPSDENVINPTSGIEVPHVNSDEAIVEQTSPKLKIIANDIDLTHFKEKAVESPIKIKLDELSRMEETLENFDDIPKIQPSPKQFEIQSNENDGFGDFDDFQFVDTKNNVTSVVDSSNPWENSDTNESDFGNFTANFEDNQFYTKVSSPVETKPLYSSNPLENIVNEVENNLEDDDFGDFDDFKSSTVNTVSNEVIEEDPCQELPVLNLQSIDNEHHIMDSITKVLTSVFIEEISEPDIEFKGKLDSLLSETWGHLMETDERQPYIVNWNNSLGQKILLKALCIDSRNILFGPKWSSHMPKYAVNLSNAPLQPQKQASNPSNGSQSEVIADKSSSKPTTWADPFTSDGQESCNTENESLSVMPRPTDLDVFEAAMSAKTEKIYSSTLSVQPIRQINLPDTHIFTPTDSEIPRSKTIHYDLGPTVLLPKPVVADNNSSDNTARQNDNSVTETSRDDDDNEYWEFQDFKSTSDSSSLPGSLSQPHIPQEKNFETDKKTVNALPKQNVAYQTQLLQPIRVEPSLPTLNWPDPGEIKGAYDDFTDFVSVSSQCAIEQDNAVIQPPESQTETKNIVKADKLNDLYEKTEPCFPEVLKPEHADDDFDTFQSAQPSKNAPSDNEINTFANSSTNFDYTFLKNNSIKSDTILFATTSRPNEALTPNVGYISNTAELTSKNFSSSGIQIQTSPLQPTPANFSAINTQNQRTTGQILQPLSLESYSQINWPSPGIDLQDLSRFNPVETLQSLKSDLSVSGLSKVASPVHSQKNPAVNQVSDDDVWGEFVSSKPKQQQSMPKKTPVFAEDDEWSDFISSPSAKPQNGLNTISFNVHTNSNIQKSVQNKNLMKSNQTPDIPSLNYITPKSNPHKSYNDKHFQNL